MEDKYCRICWNTEGWEKPTGTAKESKETYVSQHRFGHEEWLFKFDWIIDNYHYSFLQPINKFESYRDETTNVKLYAISPSGDRYWIAEIRDVTILNKTGWEYALDYYRKNGWLKQMIKEVEKVKGNTKPLTNPPPFELFNIKFRESDVTFISNPKNPQVKIEEGNPVYKYPRYHPYNWNSK